MQKERNLPEGSSMFQGGLVNFYWVSESNHFTVEDKEKLDTRERRERFYFSGNKSLIVTLKTIFVSHYFKQQQQKPHNSLKAGNSL